MLIRISTLFLFSILTAVQAGEVSYDCAIKQETFLRDDGSLKPYPRNLYVGQKFVVDRIKGAIVGQLLQNSTASEIVILNEGTDKRPFELLSISSINGKVTTDLLVVQHNLPDTVKPFVALASTGNVYSGTCK